LRILFLLFIVMPIVEMWVLITVGQQIGTLPTIGLVLLTAIIGIGLLRYQGMVTLLRARSKMGSGELPAREMADGVFFAVGGALLLTPGFVTDAIGFACLTPGIRTLVIGFLTRHIFQKGGVFTSNTTGQQSYDEGSFAQKSSANDVLEGEYKRHKD